MSNFGGNLQAVAKPVKENDAGFGVEGFALLLEDNEDDAFFLKRAWTARGSAEKLLWVKNAGEAKQLLLNDPGASPSPRLILTDLKMPECTGFEFLRWLRNQPKLQKAKCVVLSSSDEPRDKAEAMASGADGFFTKPGDTKNLAQVLDLIESELRAAKDGKTTLLKQTPPRRHSEWMDSNDAFPQSSDEATL
jgi:CheY-like chemotaxis protein